MRLSNFVPKFRGLGRGCSEFCVIFRVTRSEGVETKELLKFFAVIYQRLLFL